MFDKLKQLFGNKKEQPSEGAGNENGAQIRWLDAEESPFGIAGVDCFSFTQNMISGTGDMMIAASFNSLRSDDGARYKGQYPDNSMQIEGGLTYPYTGEVINGILYKAQQMEDKWDIYLYDGALYFCRSWTGLLNYVADFEFSGDVLTVTKISAPKECLDDGELYVRQQVDYLIRYHLFGSIIPHPLPQSMIKDLQTIALYSFSQYGRNCCFATFEDTISYKRSDHGLST